MKVGLEEIMAFNSLFKRIELSILCIHLTVLD